MGRSLTPRGAPAVSGQKLDGLNEDSYNRAADRSEGRQAAMAELADAQDLGSCAEGRVGSSPTGRR